MRPIVVVDDDRDMCELIDATLGPLGFEVRWFTNPQAALEYVRHNPVEVVLTDVRMPGLSGIELCKRVHEWHPDLPVIVLTGFGSMETAVQAIRAGAYDFLPKPVELDALELAVQRAADHHRLSTEVKRLRGEVSSATGLIGSSVAFQKVIDLVPKAARSDMPVLIQGETGTGKELLARALHDESKRAGRPFVAVNCSAIPENLVESELFGHLRGAFTDAHVDRAGLFIEAGDGTLFLDEVGELPLSVQPKLLRALQEHRVRPVGSDREAQVRCRVIAATNIDMKQAFSTGRFRSDLYYRLAVIRMSMPPLRDRSADILELAHHFVARASARMGTEVRGISTAAARVLLGYAWPGNVRELENAIDRAVAMTDSELLVPGDLPEEVLEGREHPGEQVGIVTLAELESAHICRVLEVTGGNKKAAAELLGLDRRTLYRKLERLG